MNIPPNQKRRFCFFTMIENEGKNGKIYLVVHLVYSLWSLNEDLEKTRCLETQTCTLSHDVTTAGAPNNIKEIAMDSSIVPENPMGSALFKIDSKWKITTARKQGTAFKDGGN
jgi:hypothetical protein